MSSTIRVLLVRALVLLAATTITPWARGEGPLTDRQVKAAYVYNFAKFVEWPAETFDTAGTPIRVAIIGNESLRDALGQVVAGRLAQGRSLAVELIDQDATLDGYHIVVVGSTDQGVAEGVINRLAEHPTLTISDDEAAGHGIIQFVRSGKSVKFSLDVKAAERAHVRLSSRLIGLASRVVR